MALITCPECGQQISSNAKQCVHCGYKFTYCPECQTVSSGDRERCPSCGYTFKKVLSSPINNDTSETVETDLIKIWQKRKPFDAKILKGFNFIKILLSVVAVALLVIATIMVVTWKNNSDPLEKLVELKSLRSSMQWLIAFSCIFTIIDFIFDDAKAAFVKIRCGYWLTTQKFDCVQYINARIKRSDTEYATWTDADEFTLFMECGFIAENPSAKNRIYASLIIKTLCATALAICIGICAMDNLNEFFRAELASGKFNFQYIALIVAAIFIVIYIVAAILADSSYNKKFAAWTAKNINPIN